MNAMFTTFTKDIAHLKAFIVEGRGKAGEVVAVVKILTDESEIDIHFKTEEGFTQFCEQYRIGYTDRRKKKEPAHIQCGTGSDVPAVLEARQMQPVSGSITTINSR